MKICAERSFLKSIEWIQKIRFSQKKQKARFEKLSCKKDESTRIEKKKDSRTQEQEFYFPNIHSELE